jgi:hypothetical protein
VPGEEGVVEIESHWTATENKPENKPGTSMISKSQEETEVSLHLEE